MDSARHGALRYECSIVAESNAIAYWCIFDSMKAAAAEKAAAGTARALSMLSLAGSICPCCHLPAAFVHAVT